MLENICIGTAYAVGTSKVLTGIQVMPICSDDIEFIMDVVPNLDNIYERVREIGRQQVLYLNNDGNLVHDRLKVAVHDSLKIVRKIDSLEEAQEWIDSLSEEEYNRLMEG